jgi:hypothetical protein
MTDKSMPVVPGLSTLLSYVLVDSDRATDAVREHHSEIITNAFHDRILPSLRKWRRASARKNRFAELDRLFKEST